MIELVEKELNNLIDENFNKIIELIEQRKNSAYIKINEELILLYLDVGNFLYDL